MPSDPSRGVAANLPPRNSRSDPSTRTAGRRDGERQPEAPPATFAQQVIGEIPFLRRTVRRWHRQRPDADDLVQDTLVQALANADRWQPGSNLRAWLFTIMRNQFLAAVARSGRAAALLRAGSPDAVAAGSPEARLVLRDVGAVLGRLPAKQRTALQLVGIEGQSYEEVAAAMGLSIGAVRCHLARGRGRLRAAVRGRDDVSPLRRPAAHPAGAHARVGGPVTAICDAGPE
jgi:RNA polymerase sigma-70 factor (ECF subfamily)